MSSKVAVSASRKDDEQLPWLFLPVAKNLGRSISQSGGDVASVSYKPGVHFRSFVCIFFPFFPWSTILNAPACVASPSLLALVLAMDRQNQSCSRMPYSSTSMPSVTVHARRFAQGCLTEVYGAFRHHTTPQSEQHP
mmetsp:Transcript_120389/g.239596  ORF Transcript_120389/g.239596 Transcript_120389/m.239596 type:complete len:137 (+) Transcript_120389:43-453(+)